MYRFNEVTHRAAKRLPCQRCGRRVRRSLTFRHTMSTSDVDGDGHVMTRNTVYAALVEQARAWRATAPMCGWCLLGREQEAADRG